MKYSYERAQIAVRVPRLEESAVLVNVEYWHFFTAARFPASRETPACDAILRARYVSPPTFTRLALSA